MTDTSLPLTADTAAAPRTPPARWARFIVWTAVLGLLAMLGWKLWQNSLGQVSVGPAPDFTLTTFDGQSLRLRDLRGQVVVINFWASWCVPCREEAPVLEATWRAYRDRGVVFVGVAYLDDDSAAREFMGEFGITYPNGPDLGTRISTRYRVQGIPETFFVNDAGDLRGVFIGPINEAELHRRIEALLQD